MVVATLAGAPCGLVTLVGTLVFGALYLGTVAIRRRAVADTHQHAAAI